jgi:hypothetical protein
MKKALNGVPVILDMDAVILGVNLEQRLAFSLTNPKFNANQFGIIALGIVTKTIVKEANKLKVIPKSLLNKVKKIYDEEKANIDILIAAAVKANNIKGQAAVKNLVAKSVKAARAAKAAGAKNLLKPNEYLASNKYLVSDNKAFFLIMQSDGNLVVYKGSGPTDNKGALWSSGTSGKGESFAIMQSDGNFVVYKGSGPSDNQGVLWNSETGGNTPFPASVTP